MLFFEKFNKKNSLKALVENELSKQKQKVSRYQNKKNVKIFIFRIAIFILITFADLEILIYLKLKLNKIIEYFSPYFSTNLNTLFDFYITCFLFVAPRYRLIKGYCHRYSYIPNIEKYVFNLLECNTIKLWSLILLLISIIILKLFGASELSGACIILISMWCLINLYFLYRIYFNYFKLKTDDNNILENMMINFLNDDYYKQIKEYYFFKIYIQELKSFIEKNYKNEIDVEFILGKNVSYYRIEIFKVFDSVNIKFSKNQNLSDIKIESLKDILKTCLDRNISLIGSDHTHKIQVKMGLSIKCDREHSVLMFSLQSTKNLGVDIEFSLQEKKKIKNIFKFTNTTNTLNTSHISRFISEKIIGHIKNNNSPLIINNLCKELLDLYEHVIQIRKLPRTDNDFLLPYSNIFNEYSCKYEAYIVNTPLEIININIRNNIPLKDCEHIIKIIEKLYLDESEYLNYETKIADRINKIRKDVISEILFDTGLPFSTNERGVLSLLEYAFNSNYELDFENYCFSYKIINSVYTNSPFNIRHIGSDIIKYNNFLIKIIQFIKGLNLDINLPIPSNSFFIAAAPQQMIFGGRLGNKEFLLKFYRSHIKDNELTQEIYKLLISVQLIWDIIICIYKFYIDNYNKLIEISDIRSISNDFFQWSNILRLLSEIPIFNYHFFVKHTLFSHDDILLYTSKKEIYYQVFLLLSAVLIDNARSHNSNHIKFNSTYEKKYCIHFIKEIRCIISYIESINEEDKKRVILMYQILSCPSDCIIENILDKIKEELINICNIIEKDLTAIGFQS